MYKQSLLLTGLEKISAKRAASCLHFSLKCIDHEQNRRFFPRNPNIDNARDVRERETFLVNFARTEQFRKSTIPGCQIARGSLTAILRNVVLPLILKVQGKEQGLGAGKEPDKEQRQEQERGGRSRGFHRVQGNRRQEEMHEL